ncbi:MAG: hypothetical protein ACK5BR_00245 [Bacteroidota bacterium]|jgi:hypothetical protein|nr:hypothetical protein [Algoriphagus sp.]
MSDIREKEKSNPWQGKQVLLLVLILLLLISGIKVYTDYLDQQEKQEELEALTSENNSLTFRLDSVSTQLQRRIQELEELGGDVRELLALKDQLSLELNSTNQRSAQEIKALNQKISALSEILLQKDEEIKALRENNQVLRSENSRLKSTQTEIEGEVAELSKQKERLQQKVDLAAALKIDFIQISAINGRGKEKVETSGKYSNRQISTLKIEYGLGENAVADKGIRKIYLQVLGPNKQVIFDVAKGSGTFTLDGKEQFYTAIQEVYYDNSRQSLVFLFEKGTPFSSGTYEVKLFIDTFLAVTKSFTVK